MIELIIIAKHFLSGEARTSWTPLNARLRASKFVYLRVLVN